MTPTRLNAYQLEPGASGQVVATTAPGVAEWVDPADVNIVAVDTASAVVGNVPVWTASGWVASGAVATGGGGGGGGDLTQADADNWYVNASGDTMTGPLNLVDGFPYAAPIMIGFDVDTPSIFLGHEGLFFTDQSGNSAALAAIRRNVAGLEFYASAATPGQFLLPKDPTFSDAAVKLSYMGSAIASAFAASGGITMAAADARYVNASGDVMTGTLALTSLRASGSASIGTDIEANGAITAYASPTSGRVQLGSYGAGSAGITFGTGTQILLVSPNVLQLGSSDRLRIQSTPSNSQDAVNVAYVGSALAASGGVSMAAADARYVNASGDQMTGPLTVLASGGIIGGSAAVRTDPSGRAMFGHANWDASAAALWQESDGTTVLSTVAGRDITFRRGSTNQMQIDASGLILSTGTGRIRLGGTGNRILLADPAFGSGGAIYGGVDGNGGAAIVIASAGLSVPSAGVMIPLDPVASGQATNQAYVTRLIAASGLALASADARYVNATGDQMTGALTIWASGGVVGGSAAVRTDPSGRAMFGHANWDASAAAFQQESDGTPVVNSPANRDIILRRNGSTQVSIDASGIVLGTGFARIRLGGTGNRITLSDPAFGSGGAIYGGNDGVGGPAIVIASAGLSVPSGIISVPAMPTGSAHAVNQAYLMQTMAASAIALASADARYPQFAAVASAYVNTMGDTMLGNLTMGSGAAIYASGATYRTKVTGGSVEILRNSTGAQQAIFDAGGLYLGSSSGIDWMMFRAGTGRVDLGSGHDLRRAAGEDGPHTDSVASVGQVMRTIAASALALASADAQYVNVGGDQMTGTLSIDAGTGYTHTLLPHAALVEDKTTTASAVAAMYGGAFFLGDGTNGLTSWGLRFLSGVGGNVAQLDAGDSIRAQQDPVHDNDLARRAFVLGAVASGIAASGMSQAAADARYVNIDGDQMSNSLDVTDGTLLTSINLGNIAIFGTASASTLDDSAISFGTVAGGTNWAMRYVSPGVMQLDAGDQLRIPQDPSNANDAVRKSYADGKVAKTGDTMTGTLTFAGAPRFAGVQAFVAGSDSVSPTGGRFCYFNGSPGSTITMPTAVGGMEFYFFNADATDPVTIAASASGYFKLGAHTTSPTSFVLQPGQRAVFTSLVPDRWDVQIVDPRNAVGDIQIGGASGTVAFTGASGLINMTGASAAIYLRGNKVRAVVASAAAPADGDVIWVDTSSDGDPNAVQLSVIDAKGDLIVGTAADAYDNLAVGANGAVLVADSTQAMGMKWSPYYSTGWTAPSYATAWSAAAIGGYYDGGYSKNRDGVVSLRGLIKKAAGSGNNVMFTLPVGFRPVSNLIFACSIGISPEEYPCIVYVRSDGQVIVSSYLTAAAYSSVAAGTAVTWLSLANISFDTA